MTHRSSRYDTHTRAERYAQRGVESRRRGDKLQIRVYHRPHPTFRCICGYSTTKANQLEECPICGIRFANGRSPLDERRMRRTQLRKEIP